jgi:hypothetical protein
LSSIRIAVSENLDINIPESDAVKECISLNQYIFSIILQLAIICQVLF